MEYFTIPYIQTWRKASKGLVVCQTQSFQETESENNQIQLHIMCSAAFWTYKLYKWDGQELRLLQCSHTVASQSRHLALKTTYCHQRTVGTATPLHREICETDLTTMKDTELNVSTAVPHSNSQCCYWHCCEPIVIFLSKWILQNEWKKFLLTMIVVASRLQWYVKLLQDRCVP